MKGFRKRLFLALVCVMLCLGIAPAFFAFRAEAKEELLASGSCGKEATWTLDKDGLLTVCGTGEMEGGWEMPWSSYKSRIKNVVIQEGITEINEKAFRGCQNLVSAELPEGLRWIGRYAFSDCTKLKELNLPGSIGSFSTGICYGCTALERVTAKGKIFYIKAYAFYGCSSLKEFCCDTSKMAGEERMGRAAFCGCRSLKSISMPLFRVPPRAFEGCVSLERVNLGAVATRKVGHRAFMGCKSLKAIRLNGVRKIEERAFSGCTGLKRVEINNQSCEIGAYAFEKCSCTVYSYDSMAEYVKNHKLALKDVRDIKRPQNVIKASGVSTVVNRDRKQTVYIDAEAKGDAEIEFRRVGGKIWVYSVGSDFGKVVVEKGYCGKAAVEVCSASTLDYAETVKTIYVVVNPDKTALKSVRNQAGKKLVVEWEANTVGSGYQIQYSPDKNFKKNVTKKMISKNSTTSAVFGGLTKGKTYYVRIRTVKKSGKDSLYSGWSDAESVKISK